MECKVHWPGLTSSLDKLSVWLAMVHCSLRSQRGSCMAAPVLELCRSLEVPWFMRYIWCSWKLCALFTATHCGVLAHMAFRTRPLSSLLTFNWHSHSHGLSSNRLPRCAWLLPRQPWPDSSCPFPDKPTD